MGKNHKLTLYASYYLARFNNEALANLGYATWKAAYNDIGEHLKVKHHTVRNYRDEFDSFFGNRKGWYQRPLRSSLVRVIQALDDLNEFQIRELITNILFGKLNEDSGEEEQLLSIVTDDRSNPKKKYIIRAPTGRAAEEFFIQQHSIINKPAPGKLIDCRDSGCGYDFKILLEDDEIYIEVKGLAEISGGVLLSDKEWRTAKKRAEKYFLCVVKNIPENPTMIFISNPVNKLKAKKNIYTTIQINWNISENELAALND